MIQTNHLNSSSRTSFYERTVSTVLLFVYFIIVVTFAVLADNANNWSPLGLADRRVFAWLLLFLVILPIVVGVMEIKNIFFKKNNTATIILITLTMMVIYIPTLIYFLQYYNYISIPYSVTNKWELNYIFPFTILGLYIFAYLCIGLYMYFQAILNLKNFIFMIILFTLLSGFFMALFFFIFVRGWTTMIFLCLIPIGADIFAYLGGTFFGKHKMCPSISPKKTWEGTIIGIVVTSLLMMIILGILSSTNETKHNTLANIFGVQFYGLDSNVKMVGSSLWWFNMFVIIIIEIIVSILGDLLFSMIKRSCKIKDFGTIIQGHGGILDRLDSQSCVIFSFFVFSIIIPAFSSTSMFYQ